MDESGWKVLSSELNGRNGEGTSGDGGGEGFSTNGIGLGLLVLEIARVLCLHPTSLSEGDPINRSIGKLHFCASNPKRIRLEFNRCNFSIIYHRNFRILTISPKVRTLNKEKFILGAACQKDLIRLKTILNS